MHAINENQTAWLLEVARVTGMYLPVILAVTTGMRRGEFLAIRWSDVNLETGTAAVRRSIEQTNDTIKFRSRKGRKGGHIALLPVTVEALREHRVLQGSRIELLGTDCCTGEDLICCREDGSLWKPDTFTTDFAKLADKAGLNIRLHDLRHSHATKC